VLSDGKVYTYYCLSKIIKTNYETVKKGFLPLTIINTDTVVDKEHPTAETIMFRIFGGLWRFASINALRSFVNLSVFICRKYYLSDIPTNLKNSLRL